MLEEILKSDVQERHTKQLAVMRGWLEGRGFFQTARALEMVRNLEQGTRKDGETPKFHHQLSVARLLSTLLPHFLFAEDTLTAAFLHDVLEDHPQWSKDAIEKEFGARVAKAVWTLSKKAGAKRTDGRDFVKHQGYYFDDIAACPIASLVKLADRAHNVQTMQGVFSPDKQAAYIAEVENLFFPLVRTARRNFPSQYPAYENLKIILRIQIGWFKEMS